MQNKKIFLAKIHFLEQILKQNISTLQVFSIKNGF